MASTRSQSLEQVAQNLHTPNTRAEAELLLRHVLGCTRGELYADPKAELTEEQSATLARMVTARQAGAPLQYLIGTQAFGDLELLVGPGVLVPRPETELVAARCLELLSNIAAPVVADVGTGSGAIALYLASHRRDAQIWATDVSTAALDWAHRNVARLRVENVRLVQCNLLEGLPRELLGGCDLVVSNPPYLSRSEYAHVPTDVRQEPAVALVCENDGLEVSSRLVAQAPSWLRPGGVLVVETGPAQAERLKHAMERRFRGVTITLDLAGRARVVEGSKS